MGLHELDTELFTTKKRLDIYGLIDAQNRKEEKKKFFREFHKGNKYNPQFTYHQMIADLELEKQKCEQYSCPESPIGELFNIAIKDTLLKIDLVKTIGSNDFSDLSSQYYGYPSEEIVDLSKKKVKEIIDEDEMEFDAFAVKTAFESRLQKKGLGDKWKVSVSNIAANMRVNLGSNTLQLNDSLEFSSDQLTKGIYHEIETHVLRYENGLDQDFKSFSVGFGSYLETEEGLASLNGASANPDNLQLTKFFYQYVYALDIASRNSFFGTFEKLLEIFSEKRAYFLANRMKRGLGDTSARGGFTKDHVYLTGMRKVEDWLKTNDMERLYVGKVALDEIDLIEQIDGLKKPKYLPDFSTEFCE